MTAESAKKTGKEPKKAFVPKQTLLRKLFLCIHITGIKVRKHHRLRKRLEERLPPWKRKWNDFNESRLGWLEKTVELLIPWLVLILIFVLLGEFSHDLNFFDWKFMNDIGDFFQANHDKIHVFDNFIVAVFAIDIYFNFFKKRTFLAFMNSSIIDILGIAPFGLIFRFARVGELQPALSAAIDIEEAASGLKATDAATTLAKESQIVNRGLRSEKLAKRARLNNAIRRTGRVFRLPRLLRIHNLKEVLKPKK